MKIVWISGSRIVGGAEHATLLLATELRGRGHVVEALLRGRSDLPVAVERAGFAVRRAAIGGSLNLLALPAVRRALAGPADVALVTTVDEWVWACLAHSRRFRTRLVLVRHMALALPRIVTRLAARKADAVVAVSPASRDALLATGDLRAEQIHTIGNPVRFPPRASLPSEEERRLARERRELRGAGRWIGFFGGLGTAKGIDDLLRAVARVGREVGETHLVVCGREGYGQRRREVLARAGDLGIARRLHLLGEIDNVEEVMTAVDLVVLATRSELAEALPLTLIEAMACGTPVLASATGGVADVIGHDGECGMLVAPDAPGLLAEGIIDVFRDPFGTTARALRALDQVRKRFDPARVAEEYEALFRSIHAP